MNILAFFKSIFRSKPKPPSVSSTTSFSAQADAFLTAMPERIARLDRPVPPPSRSVGLSPRHAAPYAPIRPSHSHIVSSTRFKRDDTGAINDSAFTNSLLMMAVVDAAESSPAPVQSGGGGDFGGGGASGAWDSSPSPAPSPSYESPSPSYESSSSSSSYDSSSSSSYDSGSSSSFSSD